MSLRNILHFICNRNKINSILAESYRRDLPIYDRPLCFHCNDQSGMENGFRQGEKVREMGDRQNPRIPEKKLVSRCFFLASTGNHSSLKGLSIPSCTEHPNKFSVYIPTKWYCSYKSTRLSSFRFFIGYWILNGVGFLFRPHYFASVSLMFFRLWY